MTGKIPWPRVLAEGAVIVVSILLALGAEAWWSGRQDRTAEATYVESLLHDLRTDSLEYESVSTVLRRAQWYTERTLGLIATLDSGSNGQPHAALAVYCASFLPIPVVTRGTLQDLLSTGALQLVRNQALRTDILGYYAAVDSELQWTDEYRANQQQYRGLLAGLRLPELQARAGGVSRTADIPGEVLVTGLSNLGGSTAALNAMLFAQQRMLVHVDRLKGDVAELIMQTRQELAFLVGRTVSDEVAESASSFMIESASCPEPSAL